MSAGSRLLAVVLTTAPATMAMAFDAPDGAAGSTSAATERDAVRDVMLLAEDRPIFLRLRLTLGDRPFASAWPDAVAALHACLDRDGNGTLTAKEAEEGNLAALVQMIAGGAMVRPPGELDVDPKDGVISAGELSEALRDALPPFRVEVGRLADGRTDALFDHLDRDKDGQLSRTELAAISGALRRLDLDDDEMIGSDELEPFRSPAATARDKGISERRGRYSALPPVVEIVAGESSLRLARLLLKRYDKGRGDTPGRPDSKLSRNEFAVAPDVFANADTNGDESLSTEELRRFIAEAPRDLVLDVAFPSDGSGPATTRVVRDGAEGKGTEVRQLAEGDLELTAGHNRLDVQIEDGRAAVENVRRSLSRRFQVFDVNKDGYLERSELARENNAPSPLAPLFDTIDRDGDGKVYPKEMLDFASRLTRAAQGLVVLTASDEGRAIFGVLDRNRDRRLGAREVMHAVDRLTSWDGDGDGLVSAGEIPSHILVTVARGEVPGLTGTAAGAGNAERPGMVAHATSAAAAAGPKWFRQMDRNRDGDVSRREFLGPREPFDRLDRDKDGLIDADEAATATPTAKAADSSSRP